MHDLSCEDEVNLLKNEPVWGTHLHVNRVFHEDSVWHESKRQLGNVVLSS